MRFVDLFAGLGGFHVVLSRLGHECVFASEINKDLAKLYETNFGIKKAYSDIKRVHEASIPPHDIMCAGFPCQPFSKAGKQLGMKDTRGNFIVDLERILKYHKPKYFILENVPNLRKHDREKSWQKLKSVLEECGYKVNEAILSPHEFGIPQIRNRIYIVGTLSGTKDFEFPKKQNMPNMDIRSILDKNPVDVKPISREQVKCLNTWQSMIKALPKNEPLPVFPIWSGEFGANYPFEKKAPYALKISELRKFKGDCGKTLKFARTKEEALSILPSYARVKGGKFPDWKISFIKRNREFYYTHKKIIHPFLKQLRKYHACWQKLEWNCKDGKRDIYQYILQFRPSGIRVKKSNYSPALVVCTTQLPIIGWEKRYITKHEAARLQGLESINLPESDTSAFKALGNAINVPIMYLIAKKLIGAKRSHRQKNEK